MRLMRDLEPGALKSVTLEGADRRINDTYYCVADDAQRTQIMAEAEDFLSGLGGVEAATAGPVSVEVLNGYIVAGAAAKAGAKLTAEGYKIARVGNATTRNYTRTTVLYRGDTETQAQAIADLLGGAQLEPGPSGPPPQGTAQVQVTLGKDYAGATPVKSSQAAPKKPGRKKSSKH